MPKPSVLPFSARCHNSRRLQRFTFENVERRNVAVPLNESRNRPCAPDHACVKHPDGIGDGAVMGVDENLPRAVVTTGVVPCKMQLRHAVKGKGREVSVGRCATIVARDRHIIDIEEEITPGALVERAEERCLRHFALGHSDVNGGVFDGDLARERLLRFVEMVAKPSESLFRVGDRQQVVL